MDANTHFTARLPNRHATGGAARAPHRAVHVVPMPSAPAAIAEECGIKFDLLNVTEILKRTPCVADLKPSGRYVAKDMLEAGGIIALQGNLAPEAAIVKVAGMERLQFSGTTRCFDGEEEVWLEAVKNKKRREGNVLVIRYEGPKGGRYGAVSHPGAAVEKACYADI